MGAGMSACARDLARFGEMLRNDGFYNGGKSFLQAGCTIRGWGMIVCVNYSLTVTIAACYPMATTAIRCGQTAYPMNHVHWYSRPNHLHQPRQATGLRQTVIPPVLRQTSRSMVQPTGPTRPCCAALNDAP